MLFQVMFCTIKIPSGDIEDIAYDSLCNNSLCILLNSIFLFCHCVGNTSELPDIASREVRLRSQDFHRLQVATSKFKKAIQPQILDSFQSEVIPHSQHVKLSLFIAGGYVTGQKISKASHCFWWNSKFKRDDYSTQ